MNTILEKEIQSFCDTLVCCEKAPSTIQKYVQIIRHLAKWLGDKPLSKENLLIWRQQLLEKRRPGTVNTYLCAVSAYLDYIGCSEYKIKQIRVQPRAFIDNQRELTQSEYKRLLSTAYKKENKRLYYILMTLGQTGIRIGELKYITIEAIKKGQATIYHKGKCRTILITKKLKQALLHYSRQIQRKTGSLFLTRNGKPVDRSNIHHEMKKLCVEAGVAQEKVFPHNLRHLFARAFYAVEKNLAWLADILGHSSIETTRIYVRTTAAEQERILKKMWFSVKI